MNTPARLNALATAVPDHILRQSDALPAAARLFSKQAAEMSPQRLARIFGNTAIETRNTCQPLDWYLAPHDFSERNGLYLRHAAALLQHAAETAIAEPDPAAGQPYVSQHGRQRHRHPVGLLAMIGALQRPAGGDHGAAGRNPARQ